MLFALIDAPILLGPFLVRVPLLVLPIWFTWAAMNRAGQQGAWSACFPV